MEFLDYIKLLDEKNKNTLNNAITEGHFKILFKDHDPIGHYAWLVMYKDGKKHIYIHSAFIMPEYRNQKNLLFMRNYIRDFFNKDYNFVYWKSNRRDKYFYAR